MCLAALRRSLGKTEAHFACLVGSSWLVGQAVQANDESSSVPPPSPLPLLNLVPEDGAGAVAAAAAADGLLSEPVAIVSVILLEGRKRKKH